MIGNNRPMPPRRLTALLALPLAVALVSCSGGGHSTKKAAKSTGTTQSGQAQGKPVDPAALVTLLEAGVASITSAHFDLSVKIAGQLLTGAGDQKITGGKLSALQAEAALPGQLGNVEVIVADGNTYAKVPKALASTKKPWTLISAASSNPLVAQLASFLGSGLTPASLDKLGDLAGAADSVRDLGPATVNGTPTTHYRVVINPAKLPPAIRSMAVLSTSPIPAELYTDARGRPIKIQVATTVLGQATDTTIEFSRFGEPVTITAPAADQVGDS